MNIKRTITERDFLRDENYKGFGFELVDTKTMSATNRKSTNKQNQSSFSDIDLHSNDYRGFIA